MKKSIKLWSVFAVASACFLSAHTSASAWIFTSDVDSDSSRWSRYFNFNSDPAGADRYTNHYGDMFVRIWAERNSWSSAGRTVSIPDVLGYCTAQITHAGSAGSFYVRDSATYTNLSPVVSVSRSRYLANNVDSVLPKVRVSFTARNKNVFARFYMQGGVDDFASRYGSNIYVKKTAYIDDLGVGCI